MKPIIVIRADASASIGSGHIMRTLTLADELKKAGFSILYLSKNMDDSLKDMIRARNCDVADIPSDLEDETAHLSSVIEQKSAVMVIFDSYAIDADYERKVKENTGALTFCFDDTYETHSADFILNQNIYAKSECYKGKIPSECTVFAGLEYALIRDEFKEEAKSENKKLDKSHIRALITLGGADEHNVALKVMSALENSPYSIDTTVVCGRLNSHYDALSQFAKRALKSFNILKNSDSMARLMHQSDIAVTAGGSTTIETLFMRLPSLVITVAQNQEKIVQELRQKELAITLGWYNEIDEIDLINGFKQLIEDDGRREQIKTNIASLFGKNGIGMMLNIVRKKLFSEFRLQEATFDDCDDLYELANDDVVRSHSFSQEKIVLIDHQKWLRGVLEDSTRLLLTIKTGNIFLGQVRFDTLDSDKSVISFSLTPLVRGLALSDKILRQAVAFVADRCSVKQIIAEIKKDNPASRRSFEKAGFILLPETNGKDFITMEYRL